MADKYTIRDFIVYFITGLFLLLILLYKFGISFLEFFKITQTDIKDNPTLTIFFLIPMLYILGHLVHAVDVVLIKIGQYIWHFIKKYTLELKRFKILWIFKFFNYIINGNRVNGILNAKNEDIEKFWKKVHRLQYESKSGAWNNLMSDLHRGLALICLMCAILYFWEYDKINTIISAILTILFWYRAKYMAGNFVLAIKNTNELEKTK
jgi:hypothetical protein